jgi:RNA polymerase sigma-54 factor
MYLGHSHSLGHRHSLVVSQQLRQAIVLLQMGNPELQSFIESQAEENPFVELRTPGPAPAPLPRGPVGRADDDWDRIGALEDTNGTSLYTHVAQQIGRLGLSEAEIELAAVFVDALAPSGWLEASVDEIAGRAGVPVAAASAMLKTLQGLEPSGIFARSLAECLRLQAAEQGLLTPLFASVLDNLPLLAAADLAGLARACRCDVGALRPVLRELRSLDPKPGTRFDGAPDPVRAPDLLVGPAPEGGWQVELNRSTLPRVLVRDELGTELARAPSARAGRPQGGDASGYIAERLSVARWLSRAVEHRNRTVLRIGEEIVREQSDFLARGPEHLKPMILKEIAAKAGVHESTVSRVSGGIMMATPHGAFPLKHFFTAALPSRDEAAGSAGAVRHRIGRLIRAEPAGRPLSDDQLVRLMEQEGIQVARRTVAKYREQLRIPASSVRRRQAVLSGMA